MIHRSSIEPIQCEKIAKSQKTTRTKSRRSAFFSEAVSLPVLNEFFTLQGRISLSPEGCQPIFVTVLEVARFLSALSLEQNETIAL